MSDSSGYQDYAYHPSLAAAVIFIALFSTGALWQAYLLFKKKTWFFIPFLIGTNFEFVGYIGRAINSQETPNWSLGPYIIQTLFILLAPAFLAASIYMVLSRIIRLTDGDKLSLIRPTRLTKVIVTGDVISFLLQSAGGGLLASGKSSSSQKFGQDVVIGGLFVQVIFFGFFIILTAVFHHRIIRFPTLRSQTLSVPWKRQIVVLYGASVLIMIRNIVRVIEYIQGRQGTILTHEAYLYIFDATLMFFVVVLFSFWHPWKVVSKHVREDALRDSDAKIHSGDFQGPKIQDLEIA